MVGRVRFELTKLSEENISSTNLIPICPHRHYCRFSSGIFQKVVFYVAHHNGVLLYESRVRKILSKEGKDFWQMLFRIEMRTLSYHCCPFLCLRRVARTMLRLLPLEGGRLTNAAMRTYHLILSLFPTLQRYGKKKIIPNFLGDFNKFLMFYPLFLLMLHVKTWLIELVGINPIVVTQFGNVSENTISISVTKITQHHSLLPPKPCIEWSCISSLLFLQSLFLEQSWIVDKWTCEEICRYQAIISVLFLFPLIHVP